MTQDPKPEPAKRWLSVVGIFIVSALAITGWRACQKLANTRDGIVSGQMFIGGNRVKSVVTHKTPDGRSFTVDTTGTHGRPQSQTLMNDA